MEFNFKSRNRGGSGDKDPSVVSKIGVSLFFLIFAGMGTFFAVMLVRSIILKEAPWYLVFFLLIPLIFMFIGCGGIYATWFIRKSDQPEVKSKAKTSSKIFLVLFGLIFIGVGCAASYALLIRPTILTWQARSWIETPCKIVSATVESHSDDDGTTYSIDITYEYNYYDRVYRSDRYDFVGGSSNGYEGKKTVVDGYKRAENPVCFIDPDHPSEAVLQRDWTLKNAIGFFPLIFVAAGVWIVRMGIHRIRRKGPSWLPEGNTGTGGAVRHPYDYTRESPVTGLGSIIIKPKLSPFGKLVGAFAICLFWNGIVSVFVYQVVQGFRHGHPEWFLTFFMIPFVAVGLCLIGFVFYQFMALFNPRYTLMLQPGTIYPGTAGMFYWRCSGRAGRIQKLTMKLTGTEEATYQVGTTTRTDKNTFFETGLVQSQNPGEISAGQVGFVIPEETMHSFEADHNKIAWSIHVQGDIARWPDVKVDYQLTINPKAIK